MSDCRISYTCYLDLVNEERNVKERETFSSLSWNWGYSSISRAHYLWLGLQHFWIELRGRNRRGRKKRVRIRGKWGLIGGFNSTSAFDYWMLGNFDFQEAIISQNPLHLINLSADNSKEIYRLISKISAIQPQNCSCFCSFLAIHSNNPFKMIYRQQWLIFETIKAWYTRVMWGNAFFCQQRWK